MIDKRYEKKFSFGIDLDIKIEDYEKIIENYGPYIKSVFFSLPMGRQFHTRLKMIDEYEKDGARERLLKILKLFKESNIELEAVVNQYHIKIEDVRKALNELDKFVEIDSMCCLDEYLDAVYEHYGNNMYIVSSYNNKPLREKDIEKLDKRYNMIVVAKEFMREPVLLQKIKNRGFDVKLLVNGGCAFNCGTCRSGVDNCKKVFEMNREKFSLEELYAIQSYFPWELKKLIESFEGKNTIDEIKISSRPSTYEYLDKCLRSYIYNEDERKYINDDYNNYHLYARQANMIPYFKSLDLEEIEKIKKELWD